MVAQPGGYARANEACTNVETVLQGAYPQAIVDGYETALWLYAFREKRIAPVLEGLVVDSGVGENDQQCAGWYEATSSTLSMGTKDANGYRTLVIDQSTVRDTMKPDGDECVTNSAIASKKRYILHYGDPHYGLFGNKSAYKDASCNNLFSAILSDR